MRQSIIALSILGSAFSLNSLPAMAQTNPAPSAGSGFSVPSPTPSTPDVYFINRAKNLARQAAITANGGLERYRPDPIMFGPAVQTQFVRNADGSITFSFTGGAPGASPSIETVATVVPNGSVKLDYNGPLRSGGVGSIPVTTQTLPSQTPVQIPVPSSAPSSAPKPNPGSGFPSLPKLPSSSAPSIQPLPPVSTMPPASTPLPRPMTGNGNSSSPNWINEDAFFARARNLARQAAIKANGGLARYRPEPSMFGPSARTPAVKNANGSITFNFKGGAPNTSELIVQSVVTVEPAGSVNLEYNGPVR
jgi:hypothetical protein